MGWGSGLLGWGHGLLDLNEGGEGCLMMETFKLVIVVGE